jgi:hypothetical protein
MERPLAAAHVCLNGTSLFLSRQRQLRRSTTSRNSSLSGLALKVRFSEPGVFSTVRFIGHMARFLPRSDGSFSPLHVFAA